MLSLLVAAFCLSSTIGETLFAAGWAAAISNEIKEARWLLRVAARVYPLRDEIRKGPGYLALRYMPQMLIQDVVADMEFSLVYDPYAPDLLNALIWVEIIHHDYSEAQANFVKLQRVEPGFVPDYLAQR